VTGKKEAEGKTNFRRRGRVGRKKGLEIEEKKRKYQKKKDLGTFQTIKKNSRHRKELDWDLGQLEKRRGRENT